MPAAERPQSYFDSKETIYRFDPSIEEEVYTIAKLAQQKGKWRINNFGWNSPIDYFPKKEKKLIAILGDSYIEALQVDIDKSYPSLLRKALNDKYDIYSFGMSGAPLSEYLNYSRYVSRNFNPDILIFNVVHNDFTESVLALDSSDLHRMMLTLNVQDTFISENCPIAIKTSSQFNWKKRLMKKSAVFRYIYYNLAASQFITNIQSAKTDTTTYSANVYVNSIIENEKIIEKAVDYILNCIDQENPDKRIIFVLDGPRNEIYNDTWQDSDLLFLNEILRNACNKYDFELIDLLPSMVKDYKAHQLKFNSKWDGHWNEYGHSFVAKKLLEELKL